MKTQPLEKKMASVRRSVKVKTDKVILNFYRAKVVTQQQEIRRLKQMLREKNIKVEPSNFLTNVTNGIKNLIKQ